MLNRTYLVKTWIEGYIYQEVNVSVDTKGKTDEQVEAEIEAKAIEEASFENEGILNSIDVYKDEHETVLKDEYTDEEEDIA